MMQTWSDNCRSTMMVGVVVLLASLLRRLGFVSVHRVVWDIELGGRRCGDNTVGNSFKLPWPRIMLMEGVVYCTCILFLRRSWRSISARNMPAEFLTEVSMD